MKKTYINFFVLRYKNDNQQQQSGGQNLFDHLQANKQQQNAQHQHNQQQDGGYGMNNLYHQMMNQTSGVEQQEEALINLIISDPTMLNDPDTKALYDAYMAKNNGAQQQQNQQSQQAGVQNQNNQQQQAGAQQQQQNNIQISQEQFVAGGGGLFFNTPQSVDLSDVTPENFTQKLNIVGIDSTKPDWAKNILASVIENTKKVKALEEIKTKYEQVDQNIQNLPTPLLHAMDASLRGKDWRKELSNFDIDYRLDFDKMTPEQQLQVTKRLLPEMIIDETQATSPQYLTAINLGKNAFNQHKQSVEAEFLKQQQQAELRNKTYQASVGTSLGKLAENYEEFKEAQNVAEVENILKNKLFLRIFYDANGNLLDDAAERVALAIYGKNVVDRAKGIGATKLANDKLAQIVSQQQSKGEGGNGVTNVTRNQEESLLAQSTTRALKMYEQTY